MAFLVVQRARPVRVLRSKNKLQQSEIQIIIK
jgi:hypothetical protein